MDLHAQIMNLPQRLETAIEHPAQYEAAAYAKGHRDARHQAAELALKADACIEALRFLMRGNVYKTIQGVSAWHEKAMPNDSDLDRAREALDALNR